MKSKSLDCPYKQNGIRCTYRLGYSLYGKLQYKRTKPCLFWNNQSSCPSYKKWLRKRERSVTK